MPRRRKASGKSASSTLLVLIVLVVLGFIYSLTGRDPGGVFGTETQTPPVAGATQTSAAANVPTAANASGTWWEVYFTDPVN